MTFDQRQIIEDAKNHALAINNYLDDDVVQEGINDLGEAETLTEALHALSYVAMAINYRKVDRKSLKYADSFAASLEPKQQ